MKPRPIRLVYRRLLFGVGLIAAVGLVAPRTARVVQRQRVEAAIARFEENPSQERADALIQLLTRKAANDAQGERILTRLLYPKVVARSAYPFGKTPVFSMERLYEVHFPHSTVSRQAALWVGGKERQGAGSQGGNVIGVGPEFYYLTLTAQEPGIYDVEIRYEYAVTRMTAKTRWSWAPFRGPLPWSLLPQRGNTWSASHSDPDYTCRFAVPVTLRIAEEGEAEKVDLLSNPELDERMRNAFAIGGTFAASGTYDTPAGKRRYTCNSSIVFSTLPSAVAFKAALRLANGVEVALPDAHPEPHRARANTSGIFPIRPAASLLAETGQQHATLILSPDVEHAYQDPAIKAIWDGTLEFPIQFTIAVEDDRPPQR